MTQEPARRESAVDPLPPGTLRIDVTPDRDRVLVCPVGDVDLATAGQLASAIAEPLESGVKRVVIDLRGVTFLDSSGIHALLDAHHRARDRGKRVALIPGAAAVMRPLEITGVIDRLELETRGADERTARDHDRGADMHDRNAERLERHGAARDAARERDDAQVRRAAAAHQRSDDRSD